MVETGRRKAGEKSRDLDHPSSSFSIDIPSPRKAKFWLSIVRVGDRHDVTLVGREGVDFVWSWPQDWWKKVTFRDRTFKRSLEMAGLSGGEISKSWLTCCRLLAREACNIPAQAANYEEEEDTPDLGEEDLSDEAEEYLKDPGVFDKICAAAGTMIKGEETPIKATILQGLVAGQHTKRPFGMIAIDQASVGKSHLFESILTGLFPPEIVDHPTSFSTKALNYLEQGFEGRIILLDELAGAEEEKSDLRTWISAGRLERWVAPSTEDEEKVTQKHNVDGCPVFLASTTKPHTEDDGQLLQRNLIIHLDGTPEQTQRIHDYQAERDQFPDSIFTDEEEQREKARQAIRHVLALSRIQKLKGLIPFSDRIKFPHTTISTRRDRQKFIQLLRSSALLHVYQRAQIEIDGDETRYVIAAITDFQTARNVYEDYLQATMLNLDDMAMKILKYLSKMSASNWTVRDTLENLQKDENHGGLSEVPAYNTLREKLNALANGGHLVKDDQSKAHTYSVEKPYKTLEDAPSPQQATATHAVISLQLFTPEDARRWLQRYVTGNTGAGDMYIHTPQGKKHKITIPFKKDIHTLLSPPNSDDYDLDNDNTPFDIEKEGEPTAWVAVGSEKAVGEKENAEFTEKSGESNPPARGGPENAPEIGPEIRERHRQAEALRRDIQTHWKPGQKIDLKALKDRHDPMVIHEFVNGWVGAGALTSQLTIAAGQELDCSRMGESDLVLGGLWVGDREGARLTRQNTMEKGASLG